MLDRSEHALHTTRETNLHIHADRFALRVAMEDLVVAGSTIKDTCSEAVLAVSDCSNGRRAEDVGARSGHH